MTLQRLNGIGGSTPRFRSPLVALRYEETVQAEPPIPVINTPRLSRPRSMRSLASAASVHDVAMADGSWPTLQTASASPARRSLQDLPCTSDLPVDKERLTAGSPSSSTVSLVSITSLPRRLPLVIIRPPSLVAPSAEQHPALRSRRCRPIAEEADEEDAAAEDSSCGVKAKDMEDNRRAVKTDSLLMVSTSASASASTVTLMCASGEDGDGDADADAERPTHSKTECHRHTGSDTFTATCTASCLLPPPYAVTPSGCVTAQVEAVAPGGAVPPHSPTRTSSVATTPEAAGGHTTAAAMEEMNASHGTHGPQEGQAQKKTDQENKWCLPKSMFRFRANAFSRKKPSSNRLTKVASTAGHAAELRPSPGGVYRIRTTSSCSTSTNTSACTTSTSASVLSSPTASLAPLPARPAQSAVVAAAHNQTARGASPDRDWLPILASSSSFIHQIPDPEQVFSPFPLPAPPIPSCTPSSPLAPATPSSASSVASSPTSPLSPTFSAASFASSSSTISTSSPANAFSRALSMSDLRPKAATTTTTTTTTVTTTAATRAATTAATAFVPLSTAIPTDSLLEDDFLQSLTFSKRGSLMFGGKRALAVTDAIAAEGATATSAAAATSATSAPAASPAPSASSSHAPRRALPLPVQRESHKVRSLYASAARPGRDDDGLLRWEDGRPPSVVVVDSHGVTSNPTANGASVAAAEAAKDTLENAASPDLSSRSISVDGLLHPYPSAALHTTDACDATGTRISIVSTTSATSAPTSLALTETASTTEDTVSTTIAPALRSPSQSASPSNAPATAATQQLALAQERTTDDDDNYGGGGLEDWDDVDAADVDRFGFIHDHRQQQQQQRPLTASTMASTASRVSSMPKKGSRLYRGLHRSSAARSMHSQLTQTTTASLAAKSSLRAAANRLPHNRGRRWVDSAGNMLTLEPGLGDIAEDEEVERVLGALKRKEWERSEKWRRMAKVVTSAATTAADVGSGGGMDFEFDLRHPKLVERTWKGIPDCWRAAAWYSFLASGARQRRAQRAQRAQRTTSVTDKDNVLRDGGETDAELVAAFQALQAESSPDDVQIDLDVPRTVNGHVLFRRRYRGGQRLLFRVLHAQSLYLPETGYVQGMASLAATLLCYYDEERSFVMLVRLFALRGLERLYQPGFGGLMEALAQLETDWLRAAHYHRPVAQKLTALGIDAPTYATRWYLTLFHLSVPFSAQLRIWDVFMLLGGRPADSDTDTLDVTGAADAADTSVPPPSHDPASPPLTAPKANLDVLHATSAAIMDGLRDVLVDADFENAMKALTSWVPIKDEELLMKVVRAEWKRHQKHKGKS